MPKNEEKMELKTDAEVDQEVSDMLSAIERKRNGLCAILMAKMP